MIAYKHMKRGSELPQAKLTEEQVAAIRQAKAKYLELRRLTAGYSAQNLALEYGVSRQVIHGIWNGEYWSHVDGR